MNFSLCDHKTTASSYILSKLYLNAIVCLFYLFIFFSGRIPTISLEFT